MKQKLFFALLVFTVLLRPVQAIEKIEDFLGAKFGSDRSAAKAAMISHGYKFVDDKGGDYLSFKDGTYSGQAVKELRVEFTNEKLSRATVVFEVHSGKREECARLGLDAYDQVRKALTEKYGAPASTTSVPRAKILSDKTPANTTLKSVWRTQSTLTGVNRSITLSTATIALYTWVLNVVYDDSGSTASGQGTVRKDI